MVKETKKSDVFHSRNIVNQYCVILCVVVNFKLALTNIGIASEGKCDVALYD